MALQVNIPLPGGIEHANGYVRAVKTITDDNGKEQRIMPKRLVAPAVDKFKFAYSPDDAATPAAAYAKLKTHDTFKGKTTDV